MHYRIIQPSNANAVKVLKNIQDWLKNDREMQRDRSRLVHMCCVKVPAHLTTRPSPSHHRRDRRVASKSTEFPSRRRRARRIPAVLHAEACWENSQG
jgi:hypothetical protein